MAILDEASLLATCAYIDLNPVAAGIAVTPEKSPHTSIKSRVDHCTSQGNLQMLRGGSPYASKVNVERGHWLFPIEDRRDPNGNGVAGMLRGISLSGYLQLVDWSSRLIRPGEVNLSSAVPDILTRLQVEAEGWKAKLEKLISSVKRVGTYFGGTHRLNEVAVQCGAKYLKNVVGREAPLTVPSMGQFHSNASNRFLQWPPNSHPTIPVRPSRSDFLQSGRSRVIPVQFEWADQLKYHLASLQCP